MHENMRFVIGKLNFVSYQFVLKCPPIRPKKPFGLQNVATYIHNICKWHIGSWRGGGGVKAKDLQVSTALQNPQYFLPLH